MSDTLPEVLDLSVLATDVALKAAALLSLAYSAHVLAGRRRALVRSALWNACLIGLLLLPAATLAFPRLRIAVLPAQKTETSVAGLSEAGSGSSVAGLSEAGLGIHATNSGVTDPGYRRTELFPQRSGPVQPAPPKTLHAPPKLDIRPDLTVYVLGTYLLVASLLLLRLTASLVGVARLKCRCQPVEEPAWIDALERWRTRLGIARRVALLRSDRVSVPVAVGWLRPAVILPGPLAESAGMGAVDAVLLHELAHVRRGDFGWNLASRVVQALYWPHPLVWPVARIVGEVREQACDDLCIHSLGGPDGYHDTLVEVASALVHRPEVSLGLAMARPRSLARRLAWIGRTRGASRCLMLWPTRLALVSTALAVSGLLGSVQLARSTAKAALDDPDGPPSAVEVSVLAKDTGKPLEDATIRASVDRRHVLLKTDHGGKARIDPPAGKFRDTLIMDVWADGYVQQRHSFSQNDARSQKIPARVTVELLPGEETLGGRVEDGQGRPISGVKVEIWGYLGDIKEEHELAYMISASTDEKGRWRSRCFRDMTFAYLYLSHPDYLSDGPSHPRAHGQPHPTGQPQPDEPSLKALRDFSDVQVMTRGVPVQGRIVDEQGRPVPGAEVGWIEADHLDTTTHREMPTVTSDTEGRFLFPHARAGRLVLQVKARGHAPELTAVEAKDGTGPVSVTLGPPHTLKGRALDTQGRPVEDAFINIAIWRGDRALGVYLKTDAQGRFRWDEAPADPVLIHASRKGYLSVTWHRASPGEGEIQMTFRRSLEISGWVRDAETSKPIKWVDVEVGVPDPKAGEVSWETTSRASVLEGRLSATLNAEEATEFRLRIKANGYEPFESRAFHSDEGQVDYDVNLTRTDQPRMVSGIVLRPDGTPLQGADVAVTYPLAGRRPRLPIVDIENGTIQPDEDQPVVKTDAKGRFSLPRVPDPEGRYYAVIVAHPDFYAEVRRPAFEANSTITAQPWGRVKGVARIGGKPAGGEEIRYYGDRLGNFNVPHVSNSGTARADAEGRFVFDHVAPGDVRVTRIFREGRSFRAWSNGTLIEVKPGQTTHAEVGGQGRPVIARIALPEGRLHGPLRIPDRERPAEHPLPETPGRVVGRLVQPLVGLRQGTRVPPQLVPARPVQAPARRHHPGRGRSSRRLPADAKVQCRPGSRPVALAQKDCVRLEAVHHPRDPRRTHRRAVRPGRPAPQAERVNFADHVWL